MHFTDAINSLLDDEVLVFVELGPHPILLHAISQTSQSRDRQIALAACGRRENGEYASLLAALGQLWAVGCPIDWSGILPKGDRTISLPRHPWQRERHWLDVVAAPIADNGLRCAFLGAAVASSIQPGAYLWNVEISVARFPYLADHVVNGITVLPAAAFLDLALEAAGQIRGHDSVQLSSISIETALILPQSGACVVQIAVEPGPTGSPAFTISSRSGVGRDAAAEWTRHARGIIADLATGDHGDLLCAPDGAGRSSVPTLIIRT